MILTVFMVMAVLLTSVAAWAQNNLTLIFLPGQAGVVDQGVTLTCSGGPPFSVEIPSGGAPGNCDVTELGGPPVGLVCDTPTTVPSTTGGVSVLNLQGLICSAPVASPAEAPPAKAPPGGGGGGGGGWGDGGGAAPITQEGEQDSEAGEIGQSFEVS